MSRTRNVGSVSQTIFRALDKMAAGSGLGTRVMDEYALPLGGYAPLGIEHKSSIYTSVLRYN